MRAFLALNLFVFATLLSFSQSTGRLLNISYGKYAVGLFQQKFRYNDSVGRLYRFPKMFHGNFNYLEGHILGKLNLPLGHPWSKVGYDAVLAYETLCELALLMLDHYLKELSTEKLEAGVFKIKQKLPKGFVY